MLRQICEAGAQLLGLTEVQALPEVGWKHLSTDLGLMSHFL